MNPFSKTLLLIPVFCLCGYTYAENGVSFERYRTNRFSRPLPGRVFLTNNELLTYKITWAGITGGYASLSSQTVSHADSNSNFVPLGKNISKECVIFRITGQTTPFVSLFYNLEMELLSIGEPGTYHAWFYRENRLERGNRFFHTLDFTHYTNAYIFRDIKNNKTNLKPIPAEKTSLDVVSSLYAARSIDLEPETITEMQVYYREKLYDIQIITIGKEIINTQWGKKTAILIIPRMEFKGVFMNKSDIIIYLSDDEHKIPLAMQSKLSVGTFRATLIEGYY